MWEADIFSAGIRMKIALEQYDQLTDDGLNFIKQLGVGDVVFDAFYGSALPGEKHWEVNDLYKLRARCEEAGLRLAAIENVPLKFYDKLMLGMPGKDEQLEDMAITIRNMGEAGIPIFGYHWMPTLVWRTSWAKTTQRGVTVQSFDMEVAKRAPLSYGRVYSDDEMWANYDYFMKGIVPVAEKADVKLALHPDDPPVESLGGIARIFRSFEALKRAIEKFDSPVNGLNFCHGTWSEMRGGEGVLDGIRYFGKREKIFSFHFRDVQGNAYKFQECFVNEGNCNMYEALKALKEVGYTGHMIPDHVPAMAGGREWGPGPERAYVVGYMTALLDVLNAH
jgi:mannonate dehydratase